ncbi:MAG: hypothetical protein KF708_22640 [Pirellulales bacterium]|nr:hypothetical protein [Pirellulales bacterium]
MAMPPSTQEFWQLAQKARLLTAAEAARLQVEFARHRPDASGAETAADATSLARWLVANGQITRYQAKTLLAGRAGPFLLGNYVLREAIREGRLAGLARARHVASGYDVLLAFCDETTASSPTRLAQWERAARAACKTISPRLSRTYEVVTLGKRRFAVVENLLGATVAERQARGEKFTPEEACRIVYEVAITAITFDGAGRVHGEIRADNVWLDDAGHVKLLQFPLASAASKQKTEGASAAHADVRALGTLLYWMLFGRSPSADAREGRNPLARAAADLPVPYARLLEYLLTSDPAKRYQTLAMAVDGLAALVPVSAGEAVAEPPDPARLAYEATLATPPGVTAEIPAVEVDPISLAETVAWPIEQIAPALSASGEHPVVRPATAPVHHDDPFASLVHTTTTRRPPQGNPLLLLAVLLAVAGASGFGVYAWLTYGGSPSAETAPLPAPTIASAPVATPGAPSPDSESPRRAEPQPTAPSPTAPSAPPAPEDLGVWQSPTSGEAVDLAWIAPTSQMFLVWRPAEFLAQPEGERVLASFGALGQQTRQALEKLVGLPWPNVEQLTVGFLPDGNGGLRYSLVVRTLEPVTSASLLSGRGPAIVRSLAGQTVQELDGYGYFLPPEEEKLLVVAPFDELGNLIADEGTPPALRRELAELLSASDRDRHVTWLFVPSFLSTGGRALLTDGAERLRMPLVELFADDTAAVLASAHLTADDLFLELRLAGTTETLPDALVARWQDRATTLPAEVSDYVASLAPSAYSAKVLERFPEMVSILSRFTRSGVEDRCAVLRAYLPVVAAHNLTLGTQLALVEQAASGTTAGGTPLADTSKRGLAELLNQSTSLSFPRNTLEQALLMLGEGIGTEIVILGADLQLEGITKNQSFGLDERNQPAREILLKILRQANPDGKLVYVVRAKEDGSGEALFVTTRAAAAKRGETLPPELATEPMKSP